MTLIVTTFLPILTLLAALGVLAVIVLAAVGQLPRAKNCAEGREHAIWRPTAVEDSSGSSPMCGRRCTPIERLVYGAGQAHPRSWTWCEYSASWHAQLRSPIGG